MKIRTFQLVERALLLADFPDKEIKSDLKKLLTAIDIDLDEAGFEESAVGEDLCDTLKETLDDYDAENPPDEEDKDVDEDEIDTGEDEDDDKDDGYDPLVDKDTSDDDEEPD